MENQKIKNLKNIYNKLTDLYHEAESLKIYNPMEHCPNDIESAIGNAENAVEAEIRREKLKDKLEFKVEWIEGYGDVPPEIKSYRELEKDPFDLDLDLLDGFLIIELGKYLEHGDPSGLLRFTKINDGKQKLIDLEE